MEPQTKKGWEREPLILSYLEGQFFCILRIFGIFLNALAWFSQTVDWGLEIFGISALRSAQHKRPHWGGLPNHHHPPNLLLLVLDIRVMCQAMGSHRAEGKRTCFLLLYSCNLVAGSSLGRRFCWHWMTHAGRKVETRILKPSFSQSLEFQLEAQIVTTISRVSWIQTSQGKQIGSLLGLFGHCQKRGWWEPGRSFLHYCSPALELPSTRSVRQFPVGLICDYFFASLFGTVL